MKQMNFPLLLLIALFSLNAGCKKENTLEDEIAKLPPATQTGANTFGCLVNGKAWVAQNGCRLICDPAFKVYYDGTNGGIVSIHADYKIPGVNQSIVLSTDSSNFFNYFDIILRTPAHTSFSFAKDYNWIGANDSPRIFYKGFLHFTKYTLSERIISGKFEFTLFKPGWDSIRVTNGRFDGRLY